MAMAIIRPCRSRSVVAYSRQTFPWTLCRSVCRYVCLSSALWKNGGSDLDAVQHRRSDGSRDEAGFEDQSTEKGTFGGEFVACHCPQGPTGRTCATALRHGPLAKLLWVDLLHISSCNMDRLNKIFNFVLSPMLQQERRTTAAGMGQDQQRRTSPVQNSNSHTWLVVLL